MAQQDGCYTAGLKAVGLGTNKDMTETPKARPTGGRTSSTIVFPPQSPYRAVLLIAMGDGIGHIMLSPVILVT